MKIVRFNGGLGNQVFQYIFLRYIEEKTGEPCIIDDTELLNYSQDKLDNPAYNGYWLERAFNIKHTCLSQTFDADVFDEFLRLSRVPLDGGIIRRGIVHVFKEFGVDLFTVQEANFYDTQCGYHGNRFSTPANQFYPDVLNFKGDLYYYGYWINAQWFMSVAEKMLKELTFVDIPDDRNKKYLEQIKASNKNSVSIHVRRGDFVKLGWCVDLSLFEKMINSMREKISKPDFFIFSDDMQWVKENQSGLGLKETDSITYVEGNYRETSYIDLQLMKECRGMIFTNSSFSYLASLLNIRKDKIVFQTTGREVVYYK